MKITTATRFVLALCVFTLATSAASVQVGKRIPKIPGTSKTPAVKQAERAANSSSFRGTGSATASSTYASSPFARSTSSTVGTVTPQKQVSKSVQAKSAPVQTKRTSPPATPPKTKPPVQQPPKKTITPIFNDAVTRPGKVEKMALPPSAASKLPQMKGMGEKQAVRALEQRGFKQQGKTTREARNRDFKHSDGSSVKVHPYGNKTTKPFKSANNAHFHKTPPATHGRTALTDRGIHSKDKAKTHIGGKNPKDLPSVRNRPHGDGKK